MQVWAVMQIANEADIISYTIRHLFSQGIDGIIVNNNLSSDKTGDILAVMQREFGTKRLVIQEDNDPAFYQAKKVNAMALEARKLGATWIISVDGDELWYSLVSPFSLAGVLRSLDKRVTVVSAHLWNHFETAKDVDSPNPYQRMVWRYPHPNPLDKMAVRYDPGLYIDRGNHRILGPSGVIPAMDECQIAVRHLSARSADHFVRKSVANATVLELAVDEPYDVGRHCREYKSCVVNYGAAVLKEHYYRHFHFTEPEKSLILDPAPYTGDLV